MTRSFQGGSMNKLAKLFNEKVLSIAIIALIIAQPIIDMDYLIYGFLDQFGLPRFSTIVRFLIIPGLIVWTFFLKDKNKKKTLLVGGLYGAVLAVYFYFHCQNAITAYSIMGFTTNFEFSIYQELVYILTLILPFGLTYCIYHMKITEKMIKMITYVTSSIIALPIFFGDLFVFGISTYEGYTMASFISWFTGGYEIYHPRVLASKFFFNEGNTIGILMFMLLPLLYYFFSKAINKKEKIAVGILIAIHSLSMQILATRVATYGAVLIPIAFLILYIFSSLILKNEKFKTSVLIFTICMAALFGAILNFTPAVVNQSIDAINDVALSENGAADKGREELDSDKAKALIPGTKEFDDFYIYMFEDYGIRAKYASSIPKQYYLDWYNYKYDPKYWVDVLFLPLEQRVGGRTIQTNFMNYKLSTLNSNQRFWGAGYSTFMNGSILLEQDFKQQWLTLGPLGSFLTTIPWVIAVLGGAILVIIKWKKLFKLDIFVYAMSLVAALATAYTSGHTLDQFITTTFMALLLAILLNKIVEAYKKGE